MEDPAKPPNQLASFQQTGLLFLLVSFSALSELGISSKTEINSFEVI